MAEDIRPALAIDVGGTKLAAGIVEYGGRLSISRRAPTPHGMALGAEQNWKTLEGLLDHVLHDAGLTDRDIAGVGCGCGGPMSWPAGRVSPLNVPAWRDFPLRDRLRERFPGLPVRLHNDAVCMAVGEHWRGAGRGRDNVLGVVISTGVGGGLVLQGRLIDGASGNAGHVGHVIVDPDGPPCPCGGRGCLESVAGGPAVIRRAQERGWRPGQPGVTGRDLAADASRGHDVARAVLQETGHAVGVAIASAAHLADVEVVTVGGGLSQAGPLLFDAIQEAYRVHARMEYVRHVSIVPATLGQDAGLFGAAALVLAGDRYWHGD